MQLTKFYAFLIYIGSYLPLSIILLAQDINFSTIQSINYWSMESIFSNLSVLIKNPKISIAVVIVCMVCFFASIISIWLLPKKRKVHILESKHIPADLINYVIPYVLSFISIDYSDAGKSVGFVIFFGWMFWITYKSGQIIMNPVLAVFGWKLFEVKYSFEASRDILVGRMLSKIEVNPSDYFLQGSLQDVMIAETAS